MGTPEEISKLPEKTLELFEEEWRKYARRLRRCKRPKEEWQEAFRRAEKLRRQRLVIRRKD